MNAQEYYGRVIDRLRNCYQFGHYVIAAGNELAAETHEPLFPSIAATVDQLEKFTLERGLQVHLPIVGERSRSVLMPIDIEIFLAADNYKLYTDKDAQKQLFKQMVPAMRFVEDLFRSKGIPYLLDYTPWGRSTIVETKSFTLQAVFRNIFSHTQPVKDSLTFSVSFACCKRSQYIL